MIDYLEQGRTINGAYYAGELRRLRQENARQRCGKLTRGILLLQDNTSIHTSQVAMTAASESAFEILSHSTYSPMAPSGFYLKSHLCGTQYGSNEGAIEAVTK